MKEALVLLT
jgi:hypothetical protein